MEIDYRQLCLELFGTDDAAELEAIAKEHRKNARNAGRKRKFTSSQMQELYRLAETGVSAAELAKKYGTSRQVISKYLNAVPQGNYTMRITYMWRQHPCTLIDVDFLGRRIRIQNRTEDILHRAFGTNMHPTWEDFEIFLQERCFPASRGNVKDLLRELHLTDYDPLQIVEKTGGRMAEDNLWMKFSYYPKGGAVHGTD